MFERFTDRARRSTVLAQEASREMNHNYIGTEHLLLGLLKVDDGVAAKTLANLGFTYQEVMDGVLQVIGKGQVAPTGHIPFTPRAKKCLEFSLREALKLGHNYIGCEHILLGILHEGQSGGGVALSIMKHFQEPDDVRKALLSAMEQGAPSMVGDYEFVDTDDDVTTSVAVAYSMLREFIDQCYPEDVRGNGKLIEAVDAAMAALELVYAAVPKTFEAESGQQ